MSHQILSNQPLGNAWQQWGRIRSQILGLIVCFAFLWLLAYFRTEIYLSASERVINAGFQNSQFTTSSPLNLWSGHVFSPNNEPRKYGKVHFRHGRYIENNAWAMVEMEFLFYITHTSKNYSNFTRVLLRLFSGLEILVKQGIYVLKNIFSFSRAKYTTQTNFS